ncbi:MAG TPA: hypothetical protein VLS89_17910, partial [Candidatus Nanopelagicales bacterium]|nr:hypothetical protein [Candidatus Nanopelagicales bacterium]
MHRPGILSTFLVLCSAAVLTPACGPPKEVEVPGPSADLSCPAPIGDIPREDCAAVAQEFDALTVTGALQRAGKDPTGVMRTDAIRAAAALANQLKERRVVLCESYNACKMPREEHAVKDKQLAGLMAALLVLWDARRFSAPDEVERFYGGVRDLATKLAGKGETAAEKPGAKKPVVPALTGEKLQQVAAEGIAFSTNGESVTVQAQA